MASATPATEPVLYFFLLRVQWQVGDGMAATVMHGTEPVHPGESRHRAFLRLRDQVLAKAGAPANADITTFVLEPDEIGG
jgi:hypothetical protein